MRQVLAPCAVGSLSPALGPGTLLLGIAGTLPLGRDCPCDHALDGIDHELVLP